MENEDWLLMLSRDGLVEAVDGGAPAGWTTRRIDECGGLPEGVKSAARKLVRDLAQPLASTLVRRVRVPPEQPGAPSYTLLALEAILLHPADVALEPLLRRALEPLTHQADASNVSLRIDVGADVPAQISIDAPKIAWAVTALVGNALRYVRRGSVSMPGGNVGVTLAHNASQRMVSITVEDDGPGISANVQARLLASGPGGGDATGVSLRLVHDVLAAHGGGMVIKSSTAPTDRGTVVTLWIPERGSGS
jgi:signal transduction histidine kinase